MNILFVCTGNTCRSPMAEAICVNIANRLEREDINVTSAGTGVFCVTGASHNSILTMGELDIDISNHSSKPVESGLIEWADRVYGMTKHHVKILKERFPEFSEKIFTLSDKDIDDPFGGGPKEYKECLNQITDAVEKILKEI